MQLKLALGGEECGGRTYGCQVISFETGKFGSRRIIPLILGSSSVEWSRVQILCIVVFGEVMGQLGTVGRYLVSDTCFRLIFNNKYFGWRECRMSRFWVFALF